MKIVLFEFRKNILRKTVIIPMIILLIVNVIVSYAQYRFQNDPFSSEVNRYHSSAREWKYYKELHTQFDGEITEEKQDKIIKLYNNLKEKVDDGDYEKGYTKSAGTGYIFGDYSLIETNFYQPIKNLVSYVEKNGELVDQAKENIKFYKKADNRYELKKNQYIVKKYQDRVIYDFYDTTGFQKLFDYNFSDVILIIFLFLCALPLFYQERICGMEDMILATKKGRKTYVMGKYISVIAAIIICTIVIACVNYIVFHITYGLKGFQMPIYALEEFQYSPYNLTLIQACLAIQGLKCMALIVISTLMCFVSNMTKNTMMSFIILIGLTVLGLYCSGYICSDNVQKIMVAISSPFSLFKGSDIFKLLYELDLFGNFELRINVCIVIQVIFEMLLIWISYYKYKHSSSRKESFR